MSKLIQHLESFNRKERFLLLRETLGQSAFQLSSDFRQALKKQLDLEIPAGAYVAMDYHLDWIQVAMCYREDELPLDQEVPMRRGDPLVEGTQEDVDLLVAFDGSKGTHVVLIEAKADTPWKEDQLCSKARRLERIFDPQQGHDVTPYFVMMSPKPPPVEPTWPDWMKVVWIELRLPEGLRWVTRRGGRKEGNGRSYGSYVVKSVGTSD